MKRSGIVAAAVGAAALSALTAPAGAAPIIADEPLASGFAGPTQLFVANDGDVFVADEFMTTITKVSPTGDTDVKVAEDQANGDLGGVWASSAGNLVYGYSYPAEDGFHSYLKSATPSGDTSVIADLGEFEEIANPDGGRTYGLQVGEKCAADIPRDEQGNPVVPPSYEGVVESHPYAVTRAHKSWYVADAAANAVFRVKKSGAISVAWVGKPIKTVITEEIAESAGLPDCAVGKDYLAEPVPTDVEKAGDGTFYVTELPGGPEDPSFGARGRVVHVDPATHSGTVVAKGLAGATNLAVAGDRLFVTELFGGGIAKVNPATGKVKNGWAMLGGAAAIEYAGGRFVVGVLGNEGPGYVTTITRGPAENPVRAHR